MIWTFSPTGGESRFEGVCRETYLPTQQEASLRKARFSCSDVDSCRTLHPQGTAAERPQAAVGLIERLRGRDSFARLRREGTRVRSGPVWCVMVADSSLDSAFVAYAIGRASGPAVERNRVRRRLREILRSADPAPGLYLFGLTAQARDTSFEGLRSAVRSILSRQTAQQTAGT